MKKKIITGSIVSVATGILIALCIVFLSNKDNTETTTEPVIASQISDGDSAKIGNDFAHINEQESVGASTNHVATADEFYKITDAPDRISAGYYGVQDITLSFDDYIDKTLTIKTTGIIAVNSPVFTVIAEAAEKIDINAKADSVIVEASDTVVNINAQTGSVFVRGKNVTVNVYAGFAEKLILNNTSTVVVNNTEADFAVTLTNGTKVTVPSYYTYFVKTNELKQNAVA